MFDKNKQASSLGSEEGMKQIFSIKDCTPKEFRAQAIGRKTENTCEPKSQIRPFTPIFLMKLKFSMCQTIQTILPQLNE